MKVEGNPTHPVSRGTTGPHAQAELASLYDPFRARVLKERGAGRSWRGFREAMRSARRGLGEGRRRGPALPPRPQQLAPHRLAARCHRSSASPRRSSTPGARCPADAVYEGTALAFGKALEPHYAWRRPTSSSRSTRTSSRRGRTPLDQNLGFANRREPQHPRGMNRLYVVEPRFSITGGMADHRLRLRSADMEGFALALAAELGKTVPALAGYRSPAPPLAATRAKFVAAVAKDLAGKRGASAGHRRRAADRAHPRGGPRHQRGARQRRRRR